MAVHAGVSVAVPQSHSTNARVVHQVQLTHVVGTAQALASGTFRSVYCNCTLRPQACSSCRCKSRTRKWRRGSTGMCLCQRMIAAPTCHTRCPTSTVCDTIMLFVLPCLDACPHVAWLFSVVCVGRQRHARPWLLQSHPRWGVVLAGRTARFG